MAIGRQRAGSPSRASSRRASGRDIKAAGAARFEHVFVAGVSNDYLGYFLAPTPTARPSYVACASLYGERGGS